MKLEKVIEIFGKTVSKDLIVHRELEVNPTFKALKVYKITVYEHNKKGKGIYDNIQILQAQRADKIVDSNKEIIIETVEEELLKKLYEHYRS